MSIGKPWATASKLVDCQRCGALVVHGRWEAHLVQHAKGELPTLPVEEVICINATAHQVGPLASPEDFCNHKFVDSTTCLKCGVSFKALKAADDAEREALDVEKWLALKVFTATCFTRDGRESMELRLEEVELGDVLHQAETLLNRPSGITEIRIVANNRKGPLLG